jgi:hypothetical protein
LEFLCGEEVEYFVGGIEGATISHDDELTLELGDYE